MIFDEKILADIEQRAYLNGWEAAQQESQIVGSWWFALLCFAMGLICGLVF